MNLEGKRMKKGDDQIRINKIVYLQLVFILFKLTALIKYNIWLIPLSNKALSVKIKRDFPLIICSFNFPPIWVKSWEFFSSIETKLLLRLFQTGAQTFIRMFESHPDTQYIFPKFRGIDLTALEQSLVIVQHGTRVMGIVDTVVKNLVSLIYN